MPLGAASSLHAGMKMLPARQEGTSSAEPCWDQLRKGFSPGSKAGDAGLGHVLLMATARDGGRAGAGSFMGLRPTRFWICPSGFLAPQWRSSGWQGWDPAQILPKPQLPCGKQELDPAYLLH